MPVAPRPARDRRVVDEEVAARFAALEAENEALRRQLDWFKRPLFGRKSEKRLIDNPAQLSLAEVLGGEGVTTSAPETEQVTYTRRKGKTRREDDVTDSGLRFGEDVPV